jgi:polygalacturonase
MTMRPGFVPVVLSVLALALACGTGGGGADAGPDVPDDISGDAAPDAETAAPKVCSARAHGATGDGTTVDTVAIQAAVDQCAGTGGTVLLQEGTYVSGTIWLRSGLTFHLDAGARLLGSEVRSDWTGPGLVSAEGVEDVVIEGPGTLDGNGQYWWNNWLAGEDNWRPERLVRLTDSRRVTVRDLLLTQSPKWTLHLLACDDVLVDRVRIRNTVGDTILSPNTDGIDVDACRRVEIRNADIETGDDCIVVKNGTPGWRRESYDINVHDCTCAAWANGFKIGTRPGADVHGVVFRDSVVQASVDSAPGTRVLGGLTLVSDDGASVYDILADNLHMKAVQAPFFLRVQERDLGDEEGGRITAAGRLYGVTIRNLTADDTTLPGMIMGIPGHAVEDVTLENVSITNSHGGNLSDRDATPSERNLEYPDAPYFGTLPAYGLFARHVTGPLVTRGTVEFHVSAAIEERAAVVLEDVEQKDLSGIVSGTEVVDRDLPVGP